VFPRAFSDGGLALDGMRDGGLAMSAAAPNPISGAGSGQAGGARLGSVRAMRNGAVVEIRPICTDDEARMIKFHQGLSERSVYMRYFESLSLAARTAHSRLAKICFADPARETVLVALAPERPSQEQKILAVGRLSKLSDPTRAEIALLVADEYQGLGLGSELVQQLLQAARNQGITRIEAEILRDNTAMQRVLKKSGFGLRLIDPRCVKAVRTL
jgi:acetyltransferase